MNIYRNLHHSLEVFVSLRIAEFGFCARDAREACDIETLEASNTLEYTTKPDQIRSHDTKKVCDIVRNDDCDGRNDTDKYHGTYDVDVYHDYGRYDEYGKYKKKYHIRKG